MAHPVQTVINLLHDDEDDVMFVRRSNVPKKMKNMDKQPMSLLRVMKFTNRIVLPGLYIVFCFTFFLIAFNSPELQE